MDQSDNPADHVAELEHLLARLQTHIDEVMKLALSEPGHDDVLARLIIERDQLLNRQRHAGGHLAQPGSD
jgi:hypothetical protein